MGTRMGGAKTCAIIDHNVIRVVKMSMNGNIAQVKGDMVWCSTIKKPIWSVEVVYKSKVDTRLSLC